MAGSDVPRAGTEDLSSTLSGIVRYEDGAAAGAVSVRCRWRFDRKDTIFPARAARSDEEGRFRIAAEAGAPYRLWVDQDDPWALPPTLATGGSQGLEIKIRRVRRLAVVLIDEETRARIRPLVQYTLSWTRQRQQRVLVRSAPAGSELSIPLPPPAEIDRDSFVDVRVEAEEYEIATLRTPLPRIQGTEPITVALRRLPERGWRLRVLAHYEDGVAFDGRCTVTVRRSGAVVQQCVVVIRGGTGMSEDLTLPCDRVEVAVDMELTAAPVWRLAPGMIVEQAITLRRPWIVRIEPQFDGVPRRLRISLRSVERDGGALDFSCGTWPFVHRGIADEGRWHVVLRDGAAVLWEEYVDLVRGRTTTCQPRVPRAVR